MSRPLRHESDRIGKVQCDWKRHEEFGNDVKRLQVDRDTWVALKVQLSRVARGTVRDQDWEYPCSSTHGAIGEVRHKEAGEVQVIRPEGVAMEPTVIYYRVYFSEPSLCPQELWAMSAGAKSYHPDYPSTDQQSDIDLAVGRANSTSRLGVGLRPFPV